MYGATELYTRRPLTHRTQLPSKLTRKERYTRSLSNPCLSSLTTDSYRIPYYSITENYSRPLTTNRLTITSGISSSPSPTRRFTTSTASTKSLVSDRWWKKASSLCTIDQLLDLIREPVGYYALPTDPYNEVYPGIYISDAPTAMCTALLRRIGVTHVLNAAQGNMRKCGQVNTWAGYYSHSGIKFHGVEAFDNIVFRLYPFFEEAAQFIDDALSTGGKVLVHCRAGISRSATLVLAFLMLKRNMSAQEAVKTVRKHRAIIPNDGFLQQLCDLNDKLNYRN